MKPKELDLRPGDVVGLTRAGVIRYHQAQREEKK